MATTTNNLGMNVWDDSSDSFSEVEQLSENIRIIDDEFGQRGYNIRWSKADPTGQISSVQALIDAQNATSDAIFVPKGIYLIDQNFTLSSSKTYIFDRNARFIIANGKTLTVNCVIKAEPTDWLFDLSLGGNIAGKPKIHVVYPQMFGAKGGGVDDDTQPFQWAADACRIWKVGHCFIPVDVYLINGAVTFTTAVSIEGVFTSTTDTNLKTNRLAGTVLIAGSGSTEAVLRVVPSNTTNGVRISKLFILGSNHWNTMVGAVDRAAIELRKVYTEVCLEHVFISGFLREGIKLNQVFDGTIINMRILCCGTDNVYPAFHMTGIDTGTNAIHIVGLHIESCPFMMKISNDSRHNQFVACKFEGYSNVALIGPPIQLINCIENTFSDCQFVLRNADDSFFYSDASIQPPLIRIQGATSRTFFNGGNMFTTSPYRDNTLKANGGSRWIEHISGKVIVNGNGFETVWAGAEGKHGLILGDKAKFVHNEVSISNRGSVRRGMQLGANNLISGNTFTVTDSSAVITAGALFNSGQGGNIFRDNDIETGMYYKILDAPFTQHVHETKREVVVLPDGATSLNVGWVRGGATRLFKLANTAPTLVTELYGMQGGYAVTLLASNGNTTIKHDATKISLKSKANLNLMVGQFITLHFDGAMWYEM